MVLVSSSWWQLNGCVGVPLYKLYPRKNRWRTEGPILDEEFVARMNESNSPTISSRLSSTSSPSSPSTTAPLEERAAVLAEKYRYKIWQIFNLWIKIEPLLIPLVQLTKWSGIAALTISSRASTRPNWSARHWPRLLQQQRLRPMRTMTAGAQPLTTSRNTASTTTSTIKIKARTSPLRASTRCPLKPEMTIRQARRQNVGWEHSPKLFTCWMMIFWQIWIWNNYHLRKMIHSSR